MVDGVAEAARRALIVFARAPQAGRVKTRIASSLGEASALAIYRTLGARVMRRLVPLVERDAAHAAACRVVVVATPDGAGAEVGAWLGRHWTLEDQGTGDLGARMSDAFHRRFAEGAERVVIVGTDCPDLDWRVVDEAFHQLESYDVVVGPARDGGYYLLGICRPVPQLFQNIPWSSADTMRATLVRASSLGLSAWLLTPMSDIDTVDDWDTWRLTRSESD